jgi:chaperone BCS1
MDKLSEFAARSLDLSDNPYFSAGFGLGILGTSLALVRGAGRASASLAQRHLLVTLEVTSKDRSYPWVLNLLNAQAALSGSTMSQHLSVETIVAKRAAGSTGTRFDYQPCPGRHFVRYGSTMLLVERTREQSSMDMQTGKPWECLKLTALGRSRTVFESLLADARQLASTKDETTTTIFTNWGTEWRPFGAPRARRPIASVVLEDGLAADVLADVREFLGAAEWYVERGIPYRRGYLLHGPPGSGKSSFIAALAGAIGYDICVLNLSEGGLTDDRLAHALSTIPPQSLVLLEDVDAAFVHRGAHGGAPSSAAAERTRSFVTLSGLLNTLDGVAAGEERLLFMTTNYVERLDPALVRPGRVDVMRRVGDATRSQCERMYAKFFPGDEQRAAAFADALGGEAVSMATLQGYFLVHKQSADDALRCAAELRVQLAEVRLLHEHLARQHPSGAEGWPADGGGGAGPISSGATGGAGASPGERPRSGGS